MRLRERLHPRPPQPTGPPLGVLARDLRRLHDVVRHPAEGEPMARRRGALAAYDDALADACRALAVPDTLSALPPGSERDAERLRVEYLLAVAGLAVDGSVRP